MSSYLHKSWPLREDGDEGSNEMRTWFSDEEDSIYSSRRTSYSHHRPWPLREEEDDFSSKLRTGWFSEHGDSRPPTPSSTSPYGHFDDEKASVSSLPRVNLVDETKEAGEEAERVYPGWKIIIPIMLSLYVIMFLVALDGTIIAPALPSITDEFHSINDVGWYGSMYNLTRCAFVLVFGKLYSFYNPKWVLLSAVVWFEVGSTLCGAAPNSPVLIFGRAAAGIGAGGIFTGALVTVKYLFPLQRRPIVMGLIGLAFSLSTVLGPLIGGALTDSLSWRWCFYINLPLGGAGMAMLILFLKLPSPTATEGPMTIKQQLLKLDPLGFITLVPSIISLLLALEWGGTKYTWSDPIMIVLLTLFAFLFVCFVAAQIWLQEDGTVPPRIASQRSIACGLWFSLTTGGIVTTVAYYLPTWFQAVKGTSATGSGVNVLPNAIATMIGSISCGVLTSRVGYYVPFMISGPILMAIGSGLLTSLTPVTDLGHQILYQVIYGLGSGGSGQQASVAAQTVLSDKDVSIGAALMMFGQMLGSAVFISVGQNVFTTQLLQDLKRVPGLDYQGVLDVGTTELRNYLSGQSLELVLIAYNDSITRIFFVTVGLACGALLGSAGMEWKSVKKNKKKKKKGTEDEKEQPKDPKAGKGDVIEADKKGRPTDVEANRHGVVGAGQKGVKKSQRVLSAVPKRLLRRS